MSWRNWIRSWGSVTCSSLFNRRVSCLFKLTHAQSFRSNWSNFYRMDTGMEVRKQNNPSNINIMLWYTWFVSSKDISSFNSDQGVIQFESPPRPTAKQFLGHPRNLQNPLVSSLNPEGVYVWDPAASQVHNPAPLLPCSVHPLVPEPLTPAIFSTPDWLGFGLQLSFMMLGSRSIPMVAVPAASQQLSSALHLKT